MIVEGYRERRTMGDVSVWERAEIQVSLTEAIEERWCDLRPDLLEEEPLYQPERFRYRLAASADAPVEEVEGIIVARGEAALAHFLEERYEPIPGADRWLDEQVAMLRVGQVSRGEWVHAFGAQLGEGEDDHPFRRRRGRSGGVRTVAPAFVAPRGDSVGELSRSYGAGRPLLMRRAPRSRRLAVVADYTEERSGLEVPRRRFLVHGESGMDFGMWGGMSFRVVRRLEQAPASLITHLARLGRVRLNEAAELVPLPDLEPLFLVRVPRPSEIAEVRVAPAPPDRAPFDRPAFLMDTRLPISFREHDLPVIADPAAALAVVARQTGRGAYIPQMPRTAIGDLTLSPEEGPALCLAGCWPS